MTIKRILLWNKTHDDSEKIKRCYIRTWDRLGRCDTKSFEMFERFERDYGVRFWCISESNDDLARKMLIVVAAYEHKKITNKINEGRVREFLKKKLIINAPLGYDKKNTFDTNTGRLISQEFILNEEEAGFIRLLFNERLKGISKYSLHQKYKGKLTELLNNKYKDTALTISGSYKIISKILSNPLYIGIQEMHLKKERKYLYVQVNIKKIIDDSSFYKINPKMKDKIIKNLYDNF